MGECHGSRRYSHVLDFFIPQPIIRSRGMGLSCGRRCSSLRQPRRQRYRSCVASGDLPAGYATEDGVALHFVRTSVHEAVSAWHQGRAWRVAPDGNGGYTETPIVPRRWNPPL